MAFFFASKLPSSPELVGVLVMDEEVIVVLVLGEVVFELLANRLRPFDLFHSDELRSPLYIGYTASAAARSL
jgi:hypothetical protein